MSSERRHFSAARRIASGWLRSLQDLRDVLVHHAGGGVEQHQDALALDLQRADVLARAAATERLHAIARRRLVERAALQALDAFFERLDVGHQLVDVFAARERFLVVHRRLLAARLELGRDANGASLGGRGILVGLLERVAQDDQVLRAFLDLFLELAHFAGEFLEASDFLRADLGLHDRIEQHHGAEAAADAVEERQREDFEGASFLHGAGSSRAAAAVEISVNSTPGVPTRTRSPGRTRGPFVHARTIDPGAKAAVIDQHRSFTFTPQRAVTARHTSGRARQRDVRCVGDFFGADQQSHFRKTDGIAAKENVCDRQRACGRGAHGGDVFDGRHQTVIGDPRDVAGAGAAFRADPPSAAKRRPRQCRRAR